MQLARRGYSSALILVVPRDKMQCSRWLQQWRRGLYGSLDYEKMQRMSHASKEAL